MNQRLSLNASNELRLVQAAIQAEEGKEPTLAEYNDMLQAWHKKMVDQVSAQWKQICEDIHRRAHKLQKDAEVTLPEHAGTYSVLAVDANGRPSMPKQRGRRHPHLKPHAIELRRLVAKYFQRNLTVLFTEAQKKAKAETKEGETPTISPITQQEFDEAREVAVVMAQEDMENTGKFSRNARRRHRLARRINFGLIAGNKDRRSHAAA